MKKLLILLLFGVFTLNTAGLLLKGTSDIILSANDTDIQLEAFDPVEHNTSGPHVNVQNDVVTLFSSAWLYTHAEVNNTILYVLDETLTITDIGEDKVYIPLNGYVLSLPETHEDALTFSVGDAFTASEVSAFVHHERFLESFQGNRLVVTGSNTPRGSRQMIYYDANYGQKTGANRLGTEMIVTSTAEGTYTIDDFRPLASGTDEGSIIPYNGFVLSASGTPHQFLLMEDYIFEKGDSVTYIDTTILEEQTHIKNVDAVNPTIESHPEGEGGRALRGADQLIIYTFTWEGMTSERYTGTNEYGHEVAVSANGLIVDMGTNVKIPENGYVASGHGEAAAFLRDNVQYGSQVLFENDTLTIHNEATRLALHSAKEHVDTIKALHTMRMDGLYDIDRAQAQSALEAINTSFDQMETWYAELKGSDDLATKQTLGTQIAQRHGQLKREMETLRYALMVSETIEGRGLWHRPNESSLQAIKDHLDLWQSLGFNILYVETLWTGYANHPSQYLDLHPDIAGNQYGEYGEDYLKAFISEAHKRDIEVHAWNEIFFSGSTARPLSNMLRDNPEWRMVNHDGTTVQNSTIFSDPANLEVRQFLVDYHQELFSQYALDGMQFDYIRYPSLTADIHANTRQDSGYTEAAMTRFKAEYGIEGDIKALVETDEDVLEQFDTFRRQQITDALIEIRQAVLDARPGTEISMAIAPEPNEAYHRYYQEWPRWIEEGYIDHIAPMIYHGDANVVARRAEVVEGFLGNKAMQYTGIAPVYFGYSAMDNQLQMEAVRTIGAFGSAIFAAHNVSGDTVQEEALILSTNRNKAVTPHGDMTLIMDAFVTNQIHKLDHLYLEADAVQDETALRLMLDDLMTLEANNAKDYHTIYERLEVLKAYANVYLEAPASQRLQADTETLLELVDIRISRDLIHRGYWDPNNEDNRPDPLSFSYDNDENLQEDANDDNDASFDEDPSSSWRFKIIVSLGFLAFVLAGISASIAFKRS